MNKTIELIQELTRAEINSKNIKLENIRKGKVINPFPIGAYNIFYLLKEGRLSLKAQVKMIEYFGFDWELKILK